MIFLILLAGFVIRRVSLNQSFWLDEATSATVVKNLNLGEIITKFAPGDFHPPLYYLVLKVWTGLFGISEISTRFLSIGFGLATIYTVYLIGKKLVTSKVGNVAASLVATSPLLIYYSQEARMYSLEVALVSLAVYVFISESWLALGVVLALVGLTDYLPLLVLPVFWFWGLVAKKKSDWWKKFISSQLLLLLTYIWWFPVLIKQIDLGLAVKTLAPGWWQILGRANFKELALVPTKFILGRISFDNKVLYGAVVILVGSLFVFLAIKAIKELKKHHILVLWLILPIMLAFFISFKLSVFSYFRLTFVLPALYLILALGLVSLEKKLFKLSLAMVLVLNLIFASNYLTNTRFQREDWRAAATLVGDSTVIFPAKSQREALLYYNPKANIIEPDKLTENLPDLYLMRYVVEIFDPTDLVRQKVESFGYKRTTEYNFNGVVVWKYER